LELHFNYVHYQTLAHLSYSSYVCWASVGTTKAQHFSSVRASFSASTSVQIYVKATNNCVWNIQQ